MLHKAIGILKIIIGASLVLIGTWSTTQTPLDNNALIGSIIGIAIGWFLLMLYSFWLMASGAREFVQFTRVTRTMNLAGAVITFVIAVLIGLFWFQDKIIVWPLLAALFLLTGTHELIMLNRNSEK